MKRAGVAKDADITGQQTFTQADDSQWSGGTFVIKSLKVGDVTVENVKAAVAPSAANSLLGQTFLERLKGWKLSSSGRELLIEKEAPARPAQTTVIHAQPFPDASPPMAVDLYGCHGNQACVKIAETTRCDAACQQACKEYRFDYTACFTVWGPKFEFQRNQRKSGVK